MSGGKKKKLKWKPDQVGSSLPVPYTPLSAMENKQNQLGIFPDSTSSWALFLLGHLLSSWIFQGDSLCLPCSEPRCNPKGEVSEGSDCPSWGNQLLQAPRGRTVCLRRGLLARSSLALLEGGGKGSSTVRTAHVVFCRQPHGLLPV